MEGGFSLKICLYDAVISFRKGTLNKVDVLKATGWQLQGQATAANWYKKNGRGCKHLHIFEHDRRWDTKKGRKKTLKKQKTTTQRYVLTHYCSYTCWVKLVFKLKRVSWNLVFFIINISERKHIRYSLDIIMVVGLYMGNVFCVHGYTLLLRMNMCTCSLLRYIFCVNQNIPAVSWIEVYVPQCSSSLHKQIHCFLGCHGIALCQQLKYRRQLQFSQL